MSTSTLFHTVRFLRPRQIAGQVRKRLRRLYEDPAVFARRAVPDPAARRWRPRAPFLPPGPQGNRESDLLRGSLEFLGRSREVGWPPAWRVRGLPMLWEYNLHYFEYLWALPFDRARVLVSDWIQGNALERECIGWHPYPTSLRLLNWCGYFFSRHPDQTRGDAPFCRELWRSIFLQAEWLGRHLETHLLGNHLLENGAALALCGSCFSGEHAESWFRIGRDLLREQIPEQILDDGGHFERSPMYHSRIAYLLIALLDTGNRELAAIVEEPLARVMRALSLMCHPDGEIALFNDAAFGVYNRPEQLLDWWMRVSGGGEAEGSREAGGFSLPATGYHGARHDSGHYVICDAGPMGPDYLLGHAHGDIFSFELSLRGQRVITDSGVYGYEADPMRDYCRSTRAHNTVEVEGRDQSEFWAAFRVGRRGRPREVEWEATADGFRLGGWHDGYRRLPGRPRHRRFFTWHDRGLLMVKDLVTSSRSVKVCARVHLHPDCEVIERTEKAVRVRHPRGEFSVCFAGSGRLESEDSYYCPEFGTRIGNRALAFSAEGSEIEMGLWVADGGELPSCDLDSGAELDGRRYGW